MKHKYCFQVYLRLLLGNVHTDEYFVVFPTVLLLFRIQTLPEDGQPMSLYGQVGNFYFNNLIKNPNTVAC